MTDAAAEAKRRRATLIGGTAVLMWGALALLTTWTGAVPPFQLVAMAFSIAFVLTVATWLFRGVDPRSFLRHPAKVWLLGIGGLFGFHFFYFLALKNAPPVEAGLIAYLWPLLIVVFSALLPGEHLTWRHVAGAVAGLTGTILLVTGGGAVHFQSIYVLGYAAAAACALTWTAYSILSRKFGDVPTGTVGWFCAASAALGMICHLIFEETIWPDGGLAWLAVFGLGLGPVGAAFFTWDIGVKRGDIKVLGALSYAAPLISTLLLIAFGKGEPTWIVAAACLLIVGGAVLASLDMLRRRTAT
ncbi:MAG: EamA family transporter [Alphaproteobacteria bacterium]|nr:EamA family transporter [Alphaproteobacteria bacterium]